MKYVKSAAALAALVGSTAAFAEVPTTATQLASSVNMTDMQTALFAIAGVILSFVVIAKGVSLVINFVRRG